MANRRDSLTTRAEAHAPADLLLRAGALVEGMYAGAHRAIERGGAGDFLDHRDYAPGDPLSRIDWKLAARSDRLQIRRHRSEAQATVLAAVDASASMRFGSKWPAAQELAAAALFVGARQGERAGVLLSGGVFVEAGAGWLRLHEAIAAIERASPSGDSGLADALAQAAGVRPRPSIVVGVGDALENSEGIIDACARLRAPAGSRAGVDVRIAQIITPEELDLASLGAGRFTDPETGRATRAAAPRVARAYHARVREHLDETHTRLTTMGARHALLRTDASPVETLRALCAYPMASAAGGRSDLYG